MKRVLFVAVLALALPMAAFANSTTYTDFDSYTAGSLSMGGSTVSLSLGLTGVYGFNGGGLFAGSLGTMSFTTGALISSVNGVDTFASGGSFEITGNGSGGLPDGIIFKGTFSGPVTETTIGEAAFPTTVLTCLTSNGCSLTGTWYNGKTTTGILIVYSGGGVISASTSFQSPSAVPEPGTLSLLGSGLLGLGVLVRRKIKA